MAAGVRVAGDGAPLTDAVGLAAAVALGVGRVLEGDGGGAEVPTSRVVRALAIARTATAVANAIPSPRATWRLLTALARQETGQSTYACASASGGRSAESAPRDTSPTRHKSTVDIAYCCARYASPEHRTSDRRIIAAGSAGDQGAGGPPGVR
jgi:hypothetical protein